MQQPSLTASSFGSLLRHAAGALLTFLRQTWYEPQRYRPEDHYMRGPGPKWREKHRETVSHS